MEKIIIVDKDDNTIGLGDKEKCHDGEGILHRAIMAMAFNDKGQLLLAKRSDKKRLWPGYWDGTIASHPHEGETYETATVRRAPQELGVQANRVKFLFKFYYHIPYENKGSEREICGVLAFKWDGTFNPAPEEISDIKFVDFKELLNNHASEEYAPWLKTALDKFTEEHVRAVENL